jgi:hypothetical protein
LGSAIDETIETPAGSVQVNFESAEDVTEFGGNAKLAVAGFVDIEGYFGFTKKE